MFIVRARGRRPVSQEAVSQNNTTVAQAKGVKQILNSIEVGCSSALQGPAKTAGKGQGTKTAKEFTHARHYGSPTHANTIMTGLGKVKMHIAKALGT